MAVYVVISHVAITCHMTLVQKYGGIAAVLVGNFRKALTIYLSFLLFPKPQSIWYVVGAVCVFGGLLVQEYLREAKKQQRARQRVSKSPKPPPDIPAAVRLRGVSGDEESIINRQKEEFKWTTSK
jgi:hypothetical protein